MLMGRLNSDPEITCPPYCAPSVSLSIIIDDIHEAIEGSVIESTECFRVRAHESLAIHCHAYLKANSRVCVECKLEAFDQEQMLIANQVKFLDPVERVTDEKLAELEKIWLSLIQDEGCILPYLPESLKTNALCFAAVSVSGTDLEDVPNALKSKELCLAAVQENGEALQYVPDSLKTRELCFEAVKRRNFALKWVPEKLRTEEICLAAVAQGYRLNFLLPHVPERLKTQDFFLAALKKDGTVLQNVPQHLLSSELCLAAVQQSDWAFRYVPKEFLTPEICMAAVQQDGVRLEEVPTAFKSIEICLAAIIAMHKAGDIKYWSDAIKHVPESILNNLVFWKKIVSLKICRPDHIPENIKKIIDNL